VVHGALDGRRPAGGRVRGVARAVGTAGPGWDHLGDRGFPRVNDLESVVRLAAGHVEG
jgi:hypothetical protein